MEPSLTSHLANMNIEILYHSDIDDIYDLCLVNKSANQICYNNHFWINYFKYHQLPIIRKGNTPSEWIDEFKAIEEATLVMQEIGHYFSNHIIRDVGFYLNNFHKVTEMPFLPKQLVNKINFERRNPNHLTFIPLALIIRVVPLSDYEIVYVMGDHFYENNLDIIVDITSREAADLIFNFFYHCLRLHIPIGADRSIGNYFIQNPFIDKDYFERAQRERVHGFFKSLLPW